ncbi:MAG: hypothetical protein H6736_24140 [Alphaproteobacteria bacterium]|nr:hypothetical protein [Alphaproteobacteria bacterium]
MSLLVVFLALQGCKGQPEAVDADGDGFTVEAGDCRDNDPSSYPGASEVPDDGVDQDCSGSDATTCFTDSDGDGYGAAPVVSPDADCDDANESDVQGDCDDAAAAVNPGAGEVVGNDVDEDCDGSARCFVDADADGHRTSATMDSTDTDCADPGEASAGDPEDDCDDSQASIHPGAPESCDTVDSDCDGSTVDEDTDTDGDQVPDCVDPDDDDDGTPDPTDCAPLDPAVGPGTAEIPDDGIDQDCSGADTVTCFVDGDGDGYRLTTTVLAADGDCDDPGEAPASTPMGDCDDTAADVHLEASEVVGDGVDQDCDGGDACYADADDDGHRTDAVVLSADLDCDDVGEAGPSVPSDDCDDAHADALPGGLEAGSCDDGVDQDCDGSIDCADTACSAEPSCETDYPTALGQAYVASCCAFADWGYATRADCETASVGWVAEDCLADATLDAAVGSCLADATSALVTCLQASSASCDGASLQACWDAWTPDVESCGPTGWIDGACPEQASCDGGAVTYTSEQRCDGISDCADGVDEGSCFTCDGGSTVPAELQCDGASDCPDASDEAACYTCGGPGAEVIPDTWLCDSIVDCGSGEDEALGTCFLCAPEGAGPGLPIPGIWECDGIVDCPTGDDESECDLFTCGSGESKPWDWVCDGHLDCVDGSDESPGLCELEQCNDGELIPSAWTCDGYSDCSAGEDEVGCPMWTCFDDTEIPSVWTCDGYADCATGEDEARCGLECASVYGGDSIPESWVCDGEEDCVDGADEVCGSCDASGPAYHVSRNCDGVLDCGNGMDERCVGADEWLCSDFTTVLPATWLCDGYSDCPGGEDEGALCFGVTTCPGRTELHATQLCDGLVDCDLGEDEDASVCLLVSPDEAGHTGNGVATDCDALAYGACDGVDDCSTSAGSPFDEAGCNVNRCADGTPYPDAFRCDGFPDCPSGQDEAACQ